MTAVARVSRIITISGFRNSAESETSILSMEHGNSSQFKAGATFSVLETGEVFRVQCPNGDTLSGIQRGIGEKPAGKAPWNAKCVFIGHLIDEPCAWMQPHPDSYCERKP